MTWVEKTAELLIYNDERDPARQLLTHYSHTRADKALILGHIIVDALDAYIKLTGQWRNPSGDQINANLSQETVNCLVDFDPDKPADQQHTLKPHRKAYSEQQWVQR